MVYRRKDNKSGKVRPGWTFMARTQTGWKQMGTRTDNKTLAGKIEGMSLPGARWPRRKENLTP
jgi:hypothetical protein